MRIACLHLPQFALQCASRIDPSLRGAPVVIAGGAAVQACSRAAWGLGARVGMTVAAARALAPELRVVTADPQVERDTVRAIADAVLALAGVVDLGGRTGAALAIYCDVPSRMRGQSFGDRLIATLETLGMSARIGIADDRFTAWVAASTSEAHGDEPTVVSVPRGGAAAFLAPRPLSLLAITPEVQHMLEALGVATLGEFAALPEPSVAHPRALDADYRALARGDGGHSLRPYAPDAPIREQLVLGTTSIAAAIAVLAERVALRLAGRGRGAARMEITIAGGGGERIVPIRALAPRRDLIDSAVAIPMTAEEIADALASSLHDETEVWRLAVVVTGEALAGSAPIEEPAASEPAIVDALSLVLSTTGGLDAAFGPLPAIGQPTAGVLRAERREAHRRTRRKQRRRADSLVQPRLFKNLP